MTTNFKEFSAMVEELIRAVDYITPEEERTMMVFISDLWLKSVKFTEIDANGREGVVALGEDTSNSLFKKIKKNQIEKIEAFIDKNDGHMEVGAVLHFNFEPSESIRGQFNEYIQKRINSFGIWNVYKHVRVKKLETLKDDKLILSRIIFERF